MKKKSLFKKMLNTVTKLPWLKSSQDKADNKANIVDSGSEQDIHKSLAEIEKHEFEKIVHRLFNQRGYSVTEKKQGAFEGVDLLLHRNNETTYVQYHHWQQTTVDVMELGEFYVAMEVDAVKHGIVITTGEFTPDAIDFSLGKSLMLINGMDLSHMIEALPDDSVEIEDPGSEVNENTATSEDKTEEEPLCPLCNEKMVKRTAKKGRNAGNTFWGCSKFPSCRGVVSSS